MAGSSENSAQSSPERVEGYEEPRAGGWEEYPLDELAIRDERRTAEDVVRRIEKERFVLDPDFQRGFVWDETKQSRLIESILLRIPLPVFYVAEDAEGRLIVVDGRQRLTTLRRFLSDELSLVLPDRTELNGKKFTQLEARLQNRIEDCQLHFYIIDHSVPERARLDIFERVNGGEVLTRQQMRNAIYNGPATQFLRDEAATDLFKEATGGSLKPGPMRDREFVNRFCSFSLHPVATYKGDMDEWLARGLRTLAKLSDAERETLRTNFRRSLRNNIAVFKQHAFRKFKEGEEGRRIINASLFDVMSVGLSGVNEALVRERADALREALTLRMDDKRFFNAISFSTNTPQEVRARFEIASAMFKEVFGAA